MKRLCFILAFAALAMASLSASARGPDATENARPPIGPTTRPTIVCFGDSITAGYGVDPGHSYPDYLQAELDARGYGYRVVNAGVSGNTTKDALERLGEVIAMHPAVVIVELGGNDGLRGLPITATRGNLAAIVSELRKADSKVILAGITLPPNYGPDYIRQFDGIFREVASEYHVALVPMLYEHVYDVPGAIQEDGIHPTSKGAQLVARNIFPLLLPLLRKPVLRRPASRNP